MARILVIDSNDDTYEMLHREMTVLGHLVERLDSFITLPHTLSRFAPNVVILDVSDEPRNGITATMFGHFVRQCQTSAVPILIYSHASRLEMEIIGEDFAAACISKDAELHELHQTVHALIASSQRLCS